MSNSRSSVTHSTTDNLLPCPFSLLAPHFLWQGGQQMLKIYVYVYTHTHIYICISPTVNKQSGNRTGGGGQKLSVFVGIQPKGSPSLLLSCFLHSPAPCPSLNLSFCFFSPPLPRYLRFPCLWEIGTADGSGNGRECMHACRLAGWLAAVACVREKCPGR